VLWSTADAEGVKHLTAIATRPVTISCYNFTSAPHRVRWSSDAYLASREVTSLDIFLSDESPDFSVRSSHPNAANYSVDRQYRLTISKVSMEQDPGKYECRVIHTFGDEERVHTYQLTVGSAYLYNTFTESFLFFRLYFLQ